MVEEDKKTPTKAERDAVTLKFVKWLEDQLSLAIQSRDVNKKMGFIQLSIFDDAKAQSCREMIKAIKSEK